MARLKLPKPVPANSPPDRIYLHDPKVDLTKEELKIYNNDVFIIDNSGNYVISPSVNSEEITPKIVTEDQANLISSLCKNGKHAPVIDIDIPIQVVPSSQLGHYHLYIDKEISWNNYVRLLKALENAGIIESGYLQASLERGHTAVRPIGVVKPGSPRGSEVLKENSILRERVRDLIGEVSYLQQQLANGVSNEILQEVENLRAINKLLQGSLNEVSDAYNEAKLELEETQEEFTQLRVEFENSKANNDPKAYNVIWS